VHHAAGLVPPEQLPRFLDWLVTSRQVEVLFVSQSFAALRCLDWLRARHPGLAIIDYPKTDWFEEGMYGSYAEMSAAYTHAVDLHLVTSDALGRDLMARGVDAARVRTCYLNLDLAVWDPSRHRSGEVRASLGAPPDAVLLLYAARVSAEKRPLMTLDILAALRAEGHPVHLLVAGAGAMLPTMVEAAQARGLAAHCTFLGELDEASLRFVYANADLYCVPSSIEGIARTLYEALAMGLPVVAADVGGQRELAVPEVGGCIAPGPDELVRWVAAVRRLLDPAVRAAASRAARQRMEALHGVDRLVAVIEAAFDDAMTVRRTRPAVVPAPVAAEVALMGMEIARRHVRAALDRQGSGRG
jgi:glycosyltransferase involved in cell wall biosynthesis